jgi:carboxymethylenebutenolidase
VPEDDAVSLTTSYVHYGNERGYLAHPTRAKAPLPALLILHEAWGLDAHIEDVTRRFASAGYAALAPDLYWNGGQRSPALSVERLAETQSFLNLSHTYFGDDQARAAALALRPEAERTRIESTIGSIKANVSNLDAFVPRLLVATRFLRDEHALTRGAKLAAIGFCMGGGLASRLACHDRELAAAVVFYGPAPAAEQIAKITCPVLAFHGSLDLRLMAQLPAFEQAMKAASVRYESVVYEGRYHAFWNDTRPSYDVDATRDSLVRTLELLRKTLVA